MSRMRALEIGEGMSLPLQWMTMSSVVYGARGAGKSTLGRVIAEEVVGLGQRFCAIDPTGAWWGLKSSASGTDVGIPVVIFGGDHADLPLEPTAGAQVADIVADLQMSTILDLENFSKGKQIVFLGAFFERLYDLNRTPLMLLMDESQRYAPQRPMSPDATKTLGAVEDIVKLGRKHGIGPVVFTQRGSGLNKEVSELADVLIAFRTPGVLDQGRIKDWLEGNVTKSQMDVVMEQLPKLRTGHAVFASAHPDLSFFRTIVVRRPSTFDSSATPQIGQTRKEPKRLAEVDLKALSVRMADAIERSKAEDPKALRAKVAELERQLRLAGEAIRAAQDGALDRVVEKTIEVPVLGDEAYEAIIALTETLRDIIGATKAQISAKVTKALEAPIKAVSLPVPFRLSHIDPPVPIGTLTKVEGDVLEFKLNPTMTAILNVLAQFPTRTQQQLAILSGYSPTSGGFFGALSNLRKLGLMEGTKNQLSITAEGRRIIGEVTPIPTGWELRNFWMAKLSPTEQKVLGTLLDDGPAEQTVVAQRAGYSATSGGFFGALSKLRKLDLIEGSKAQLSATTELTEALAVSPVRGHGHGKRPWHLTFYDIERAKWCHREYHWDGPAKDAYRWYSARTTKFADVHLVYVKP